jgi:hypothetical protein
MARVLENLEGSIDTHAHTGPCVFNQINDSFSDFSLRLRHPGNNILNGL